MRWGVIWRSRARSDIAALEPQVQRRVMQSIDRLSETGYGNIKKLHGNIPEWSLRVGSWRVILTFDYANNTFTVVRVQHRREVYR